MDQDQVKEQEDTGDGSRSGIGTRGHWRWINIR